MDRLLSNNAVGGDRISLKRTDPRHISGMGEAKADAARSGDFKKALFGELQKVNESQQKSLELSQRMITDPDSVDPHDVTIALAEANMSLNLTKAVLDRVIRAYRDITSAR